MAYDLEKMPCFYQDKEDRNEKTEIVCNCDKFYSVWGL